MYDTYAARRRRMTVPPQSAAAPPQSAAVIASGHSIASPVQLGSQEALARAMYGRMQQSFGLAAPPGSFQNDAAEREADQLSAGMSGLTTPEAVKARLGERLGADFSNIHFHTDANAALQADRMNALAYTRGADVFMGSGKFDSAVAAHELVHTVQQGIVEGSGVQTTAPAGSIQMKPGFLNKVWDKTFGAIARKNREAQEEFHQAQTSGDWNDLSRGERARWVMKNPIAYLRYKTSQKARANTQARLDAQAGQKAAAEQFLTRYRGAGGAGAGVRTTLLGDPKADADESTASSIGDELLSLSGLDEIIDAGKGASESSEEGELGDALEGIAETTTNATDWVSDTYEKGEKAKGFADKLRGVAEEVDSNAPPSAGDIAGTTLGVLSGGRKFVKGARTIHNARRQKNGAEALKSRLLGDDSTKSKVEKRAALNDDDLMMHDLASQAAMEGTRQKILGSGDLVTGALDVTSSILDVSGVGTAAGKAVSGISKAVGLGTSIAASHQHGRMKKKVTEQTTGINDSMIDKFRVTLGLPDTSEGIRQAKRALLRAQGYNTGYREELFSDQTQKRGAYLAAKATAGDANALELAGAMNMHKKADNTYSAATAAKRLGMEKGRDEVIGSRNSIHALAQKRRRKRAAAPATP